MPELPGARRFAFVGAMLLAGPLLAQTTRTDSTTRTRTNDSRASAVSPRDMVPQSQRAYEQALIDSIMRLLPRPEQQMFQSILQTGGNMGSPAFEQPDVKRLMSQLMRLYNGPPTGPMTPGQIQAERDRAANLVPVRVALVPASVLAGERIVVLRTATDDGLPLVLLNEVDGTDIEARAGVKAATTSLRQAFKWTAADSRVPVKVSDYAASELTFGTIIEELKTNVPPHELTGFGAVRWTRILVKRDPSK